MALNPSNSSNLEQLALKGLSCDYIARPDSTQLNWTIVVRNSEHVRLFRTSWLTENWRFLVESRWVGSGDVITALQKTACMHQRQRWDTILSNAVFTCEIKLFQNYFSRCRRPSEIMLPKIISNLFQRLIAAHEYISTCPMSPK